MLSVLHILRISEYTLVVVFSSRDEQFAKTQPPILLSLFGTLIIDRDVHPSNALFPMYSRVSGRTTEFREMHLAKALFPKDIRFSGNTTFLRLMQFILKTVSILSFYPFAYWY